MKKYNSIAAKITIVCSLIVVISLIFGGIASYRYVYDILRRQLVNDQNTSLSTAVSQLGYLADDIRKIATGEAVDEEIQQYLEKPIASDVYQRYSNNHKIFNKLNYIGVQRDYLYNMAIIRQCSAINDSDIIMSDVQTDYGMDAKSYMNELEASWYTQMPKGKRDYFSSRYTLKLSHSTVTMLPYILKIADNNDPGRELGKLIININYDYMKGILEKYNADMDYSYWLDGNLQTIYKKVPQTPQITDGEIAAYAAKTPQGKSQIYTGKYGYILVNRTLDNGWAVSSVLSYTSISRELNSIVYLFIAFTLLIILLILAVFLPIALKIIRPLSSLSKAMCLVSAGDMEVKLEIKSKDEIGYLTQCFNKMLADIRLYMQQSKESAEESKQLQLNLLLAQINPHFIYNTLQTIVYMARKEHVRDIEDMTKSFIGVLQEIVCIGSGETMTTLSREVETVKQYLTIQDYRYKGHFRVIWDIDDRLMDVQVPRSILQPIIENSLYHGILVSSEMGIIHVSGKFEDGVVLLDITDNGVGIPPKTLQQIREHSLRDKSDGRMRSVGLDNVDERIKHTCGKQYGLEISSNVGKYTKTVIRLPIKAQQKSQIC